MPGWTVPVGLDGTPHIVPMGDLVEHLHTDCPCGPTDVPVERDDGSIGWYVRHHSLDGREHHEVDHGR